MAIFKDRSYRTGLQVLALAVLTVFVVCIRLHCYTQPYSRDVTTYAVVGHELLNGKLLYAQIWDHKPPAIYWTYAAVEAIAGYGQAGIFILGLLVCLGTLICIFIAGKAQDAVTPRSNDSLPCRQSNSWCAITSGLLAGAVWVIAGNDLTMTAIEPNTEVFMNLLMAAAFALLVSTRKWLANRRTAWIVGILFAAASLYKPVCLSTLALLSVVHILCPPERTSLKQWWAKACIDVFSMVGAVGASWLCVFAYFLACGARKDFNGAVFTYNRYYAGDIIQNLARACNPDILINPALQFCLPLFLLCLVAIILGAFRQARRRWLMLLGYFAGTCLAVLSPGQYFAHYYELWVPPLAIGTGWSIHLITEHSPSRLKWCAPAVAAGLITFLFIHELPAFTGKGYAWEQQYFGEQSIETVQLARELDTLISPQDSFYEWGSETGLYFYSARRPVTAVLFHKHMVDGPFCQRFEAQTLSELKKAKPKLLILCTDYLTEGWTEDPVLKWCLANYQALPDATKYKHFRLYESQQK